MEQSLAKNFAGKVLLYRTLDERAPRTFLLRNIRDALDSHERDLALAKSDATEVEHHESNGHRLRLEWEPPGELTMNELVRTSQPVLRISSLRLVDPLDIIDRPPRNNAEPSWLPPADAFVRPCQVRVIARDVRSGGSGQILFSELRQARIVGHDNRNKKMTFDVELETPFKINIQQISCPTPSFTGDGPWERIAEEDSVLEIDIQYQDSDSTAEFLSALEGRPLDSLLETAASEGIVKAKWNKLPVLPEDGELLTLRRNKGHKSMDLRYGMDVKMGWVEPPTTTLTRHGRALRQRRAQHRQLPTPVSDDLEASRIDKGAVKYVFHPEGWEARSFATKNLKCIFCPHGYEQSSFERLRLHYVMHHEHFSFTVEHLDGGIKAIRVHNYDDEQVNHEFSWTAPARPFDTRAYLDDDDTSWTDMPWEGPHGPPRTKKKGKSANGKSSTTAQAASARGQVLKLTPRKRFTEPENVEDYVPHGRKQHKVPNVPGVDFYRTISKQRLVPGTYISDSDEEVDDEWMKQRQRRDYKKLREDGISLDFNELFNRQLDEEQPMSDTFGSDAIVRFTRKYIDLLKDPRWQEKLEDKLQQLASKRILRSETVEYCMSLVEAAQKKDEAEKAAQAGSNKGTPTPQKGKASAASPPSGVASGPQENTTYSGKVRMRWLDGSMRLTDEQGVPIAKANMATTTTTIENTTDGGASAPAAKKPQNPCSGPCVCGTMIQGMRGTIACANLRCAAFGFHMACVGLENNRPMGWKCGDCSAS